MPTFTQVKHKDEEEQECIHCQNSGYMYGCEDVYIPCVHCKFGDKVNKEEKEKEIAKAKDNFRLAWEQLDELNIGVKFFKNNDNKSKWCFK